MSLQCKTCPINYSHQQGKHQNEQFRKSYYSLQEFPSIIWQGNQQFGSWKSPQTPYILILTEKPHSSTPAQITFKVLNQRKKGGRVFLYLIFQLFGKTGCKNCQALLPLKERQFRTIKAIKQTLHNLRQLYILLIRQAYCLIIIIIIETKNLLSITDDSTTYECCKITMLMNQGEEFTHFINIVLIPRENHPCGI